MLDEVKSLLQKSLRRKEQDLVAQCVKELCPATGKDQLPWKSLMTFLFEDHCLVDTESLARMYVSFQKKDKLSFIQLLLAVGTCRVSACLPVCVMHDNYKHYFHTWGARVDVPEHMKNLIVPAPGCLDADQILTRLASSWTTGDNESLMCCMKLASMMEEPEQRQVSDKGRQLVEKAILPFRPWQDGPVTLKKCSVSQVILAVLHQASSNIDTRRFLFHCIKFARAADAPTRLILFTAVARKLFPKETSSPEMKTKIRPQPVEWDRVEDLSEMPDWAVDKHTYRGRTGKATPTKHQPQCSEEFLRCFHGVRPQKGIEDFFSSGTLLRSPTLPSNPYWEMTMAVYRFSPKGKQKTRHMTQAFYKKLKAASLGCFLRPSEPVVAQMLPLLQVPTSSNKVYTSVDIEASEVIKGPYKKDSPKYEMTVKFHQLMRSVLGDVHTLPVLERRDGQHRYLVFPLIKNCEDVTVTKKSFSDAIAKTDRHDVDFVERRDLGLRQVHTLSPGEIATLPLSFWMHFVYRFGLGIGDSGLFNAIWDGQKVYGIDMEEVRHSIDPSSICGLLFSKKPRAALCEVIENRMRQNRHLLCQMIDAAIPKIDNSVFGERLNMIKSQLFVRNVE